MPYYSLDMTVRELLEDPKSRAVLEKYLPELLSHPMLWAVKGKRARDLLHLAKDNISDEKVSAVLRGLDALNIRR